MTGGNVFMHFVCAKGGHFELECDMKAYIQFVVNFVTVENKSLLLF